MSDAFRVVNIADFRAIVPHFAGAPEELGKSEGQTVADGILKPRVVTFTTLAQRCDGTPASFMKEVEEKSRRELEAALAPLQLVWLTLEHGAHVVEPGAAGEQGSVQADAAIVHTPGHAVAFTTADCLPVVMVSASHLIIAAIHAGWRGIASGIIENCCARFVALCHGSMPADIQVWIGPAIAACDYEIDDATRTALSGSAHVDETHFTPTRHGHYLADLSAMVHAKLEAVGVGSSKISCYPKSTFSHPQLHSARRDGDTSGRMATVVGFLDVQNG